MSRVSPARACALSCVSRRRRRDARMREILRSAPEMARLDSADRALASRLALGTVATVGLLDEMLDERLRRPSAVEPRVRDALRVAAFEACYLSTPAAACVSQGVELVRSVAPRAAGMANAVLRRVASELRPRVAQSRQRVEGHYCSLEDLVLVSGLPRWLVRRLTDARGLEATCELCRSQLEPAPVYVAANLLRHTPEGAQRLLADQGLDPLPAGFAGSFVLGHPAGLASSGLVEGVDVVVSDLAAQAVARLAVRDASSRVLELGQGRGTKTLLMASAAAECHREPSFVGVESVGSKVRLCRDRLDVAGLGDRATCIGLDGLLVGDLGLAPELDGGFDLVLVDAPCSGTGTMRRHPEIPWSLDERSVAAGGELARLEAGLLVAASSQVRPGGLLAYATCSLMPEEDEQVVEGFLDGRAQEFERVDLRAASVPDELASPAHELIVSSLRADGSFLSSPVRSSADGHFLTLLRRR